MARSLPKRARQFEFGAVVVLLAALGFGLLAALESMQDESERLTVELTIRNMNTGLFLRQAERLAAGRADTLRELAEQNPMDWLRTAPTGYVGERSCPEGLAAGQWCWNTQQHQLYYFPQGGNWLKDDRKMPWLTWRVVSSQHPQVFRPGSFRLQAIGQ